MTTLAAQLRRAGVAERAIPALVARETAERGTGAQLDVPRPIVAPDPLAPTARAIRTAPGGATVALNRTEQAYALHLDAERAAGRIAGYAVQPFRFDIGRDGAGRPVTYRPDFAVWRRAGATSRRAGERAPPVPRRGRRARQAGRRGGPVPVAAARGRLARRGEPRRMGARVARGPGGPVTLLALLLALLAALADRPPRIVGAEHVPPAGQPEPLD